MSRISIVAGTRLTIPAVNRLSLPFFWTPAELSTEAWFDASDLDSITESGGAVSQWDDKSGNARNVTQGNGSLQPTTDSRTLNGLNVLDFQQPNYMQKSGFTVTAPVMFGIVTQADLTGDKTIFDSFVAGNRCMLRRRSGGAVSLYGGTFLNGTDIDQAVFIGSGVLDGATSSILVNGDNQIDGNAGAGYLNGITIGADYTKATTRDFDGIIAELVIAQGDDIATRQKIEGYLAWKWGLEGLLPSGHPYRWDGSLFGYAHLWSPNDANVVSWWDASDESTITETTPGFCDIIADKSGNGNLANGGTEPETGTRTLGGLNVLEGDGLMYLNAEDDTTRDDDDFFVIGVFDIDSAGYLIGGFGTQWFGLADNSMRLGTDGITNFSSGAVTGPHIMSIDFNKTGSSAKAYIDDVLEASDTMTVAIAHSTFRLGSSPVGGKFNGGLGEVIITNDRTQGNIDKLTGYLAWKWGLEGNLPIGHPYKSAPPTV